MFFLRHRGVAALRNVRLNGLATHFAPSPTTEANALLATNRLAKTLSVFWDEVALATDASGKFVINLDGKPIKTPLGYPLTIPAHKDVYARMVAFEWQHLTAAPKPHLLPLTLLAARAVDLEQAAHLEDPEVVAKIGKMEDIKGTLLRYLDTDTLLVFLPADECEGNLRKEQESMYRPIIALMERYFAEQAGQPVRFTYLDSDRDGLRGNQQTPETRAVVAAWVDRLSVWELVALEKATLSAKLFLAGVALLRANLALGPDAEEPLTLEEVARAATLETIHQTAMWGEVEDTHDVLKVDVRRELAAAAIAAYN